MTPNPATKRQRLDRQASSRSKRVSRKSLAEQAEEDPSNMVKNVKILKDGVTSRKDSRRSGPRDHYHRYEQFHTKLYPDSVEHSYVQTSVTELAAASDRDTPLGIIDTITREYITYWLPEVELFLSGDDHSDINVQKERCLILADGLAKEIYDVSIRVDCSKDAHAETLRKALHKHASIDLRRLCEACDHILSASEKAECSLDRVLPQTLANTVLWESRILDSTLAWDIVGFQDDTRAMPSQPIQPLSPRKRRLSLLNFDGADPTDNGHVWSTSQGNTKRQKVESSFSSTITRTEFKPEIKARSGDHVGPDNAIDLTIEDQDPSDGAGDEVVLSQTFVKNKVVDMDESAQNTIDKCVLM